MVESIVCLYLSWIYLHIWTTGCRYVYVESLNPGSLQKVGNHPCWLLPLLLNSLIISWQVGTITLVALTGLLVFMLFFLAATVNAIIISALMSLAAAGGFLVLFCACLTAIYIGALSVAVFVISATTILTIIAVIVATGKIIISHLAYVLNHYVAVDGPVCSRKIISLLSWWTHHSWKLKISNYILSYANFRVFPYWLFLLG